MSGSNAPAQNASGAWSGNPADNSGTLTVMRPTNHYAESGTYSANEADAYDNDTDTNASQTCVGETHATWFGRNTGDSDAWESEPNFIGGVTIKAVWSRESSTGTRAGAITVVESDLTIVGLLAVNDLPAESKTTTSLDVTAYKGDLADLRVLVASKSGFSGQQQFEVYETWIEGDVE